MQDVRQILLKFLSQPQIIDTAQQLLDEVVERVLTTLREDSTSLNVGESEKEDSNNPDFKTNYLTIKEAYQFLRISRTSLHNHSRTPNFPKKKRIGGRVVFSKIDLEVFLNRDLSYRRDPP